MERSKLHQKSDQELVDLFKSGNDHAFAAIFSRHSRKIRSALYRILKDHTRVDDIEQVCFISAFLAIRKGQFTQGILPAWLIRIAKNAAVNHYHKMAKSCIDWIDDEEYVTRDPGFSSKDPDPEQKMLSDEFAESILATMKKLSTKHEEVLRLHYIEGYKFDEIAEMSTTKNSPITYRTRSMRALENFGKIYVEAK